MKQLIIPIVYLGVLLDPGRAAAADQVVPVPSGWTAEPDSVFAGGPDGFAVAVFQVAPDDPKLICTHSRVLQVIGTAQYATDFSGKVTRLEYSPAGDRLLVTQTEHEWPSATTLLTNQGAVVWSKTDTRLFSFSTTGEAVFAWYPGRNGVEVFSLAGAAVTKFTAGLPITGAQVIGAGQQAIVVGGNSVLRLDAAGATGWRIDLPSEYPRILTVRPIGANRLGLQMERGVEVIVRIEGSLEYTFDPQSLGENDPVKDPGDYARYGFYVGPTGDTVMLFDGSSVTYTLDPASGQLLGGHPKPAINRQLKTGH